MAIDPVDAALDALATYFGGLSGIASAERGWPEHPEQLDLSSGPALTVTRVDDQRVYVPPKPLDDGPTVTYQVGELTITAQLDLWAAYRAQRDDAGAVVEVGLHNRLPQQSGLFLDSTGYHDRPLDVVAGQGTSLDDDGRDTVGEWRRRWLLTITTDLVVLADTPQQLAIVLRATAGGVTESDTTVS